MSSGCTGKAIAAKAYPLRYVARISLEALTPLHVGTGREWGGSDAGVVLDANGLPSIPGTSIAGVLRTCLDDDAARTVFGWQGPPEQERPDGQGSRLSVSWAYIHDKGDIPVYGVIDEQRLRADGGLQQALNCPVRDHVRITEKGVADASGYGKFDETVVCAGHRFTFEMELIGQQGDQMAWDALVRKLRSPLTRFGGKTRRGLGRFKLVRGCARCFDLNKPQDFKDYTDYRGRLDEDIAASVHGWGKMTEGELTEAPGTNGAFLHWELDLRTDSFWLFGAGSDEEADLAPAREWRVGWRRANNGQATGGVELDCYVVPGSAVKGALSHRTLFHARAIAGAYAGERAESEERQAKTWHGQIFGAKKSRRSSEGERVEEGVAGRLYIDDLILSPAEMAGAEALGASRFQQHVTIDSFTGGSLGSNLFSERPLYGGSIRLRCWLAEPEKVEPNAQQALRRAFDDLCAGRLQLGGGSGRGRGYFRRDSQRVPPPELVK